MRFYNPPPHLPTLNLNKNLEKEKVCLILIVLLLTKPVQNQTPGSTRDTQHVRITKFCLHRNHDLNKDTAISSQMACHQYSITLDTCITLVQLSCHGPIPKMTLHGYLQDLFLNSVPVTATMIANLRAKLKKIHIAYPKSKDVPGSSLSKIFDPPSLEIAKENVFDDHIMAKIYEEAQWLRLLYLIWW